MRVLVTGANGFVGRNLCRHLAGQGFRVRASLRAKSRLELSNIETFITGDLNGRSDWRAALSGADAVVHCAARVHILEETAADPLEAFRRVNVEGTRALARQALEAGVKHFIFLSSIGARVAHDSPDATPYQISKLEAEQALHEVAGDSGMSLTCLRPPLIYGPEAPGNFALLIKVIERGLPLPLASIRNRRAFLYIGNLCDAVGRCLEQPAGQKRCYEIADGPGVSTPKLIRALAAALGRPARLWPCPLWLLRLAGKVTGRSAAIERLTGSLELDSEPLKRDIDWTPPFDLDAGLAASFAQIRNASPGPAAGRP
ncbi:NAD-dependent epimerase/dehydratase family protein [Denitrobaculum tricleocarpae]|uniref:NAD-dependent epimerase/dehydratase family protein n=1 Tax=Denitrobaculum tricleocarpae TaxID=2591009 RepID=A0A545U397_9PROT|nr:NAD-dependent epimerase/dehydratase family protein [Denitrobaculum tricleocarpae]